MRPTILCLASYHKGHRFLTRCRSEGWHTVLLTIESLLQENWPRDQIDELFALPSFADRGALIRAVSYLHRTRDIRRIVALDDFDVEVAADLREHFRMSGMGASQARFFRDKLAMRMRARDKNIPVPQFTPVFHYPSLNEYMARVPGPWLLKPRSEASAMGIKVIHHPDELWQALTTLGDRQSYFLLEKFLPGDVFHVDSVIWDGEVRFAATHRYGLPPMTVYHGGGVFASSTVLRDSPLDQALLTINRQVIEAMGMERGVTHAEFIRSEADSQLYFLEIAARVGGAGTDHLVEHATGLNPWREWARIVVADIQGEDYTPPSTRQDYAGLIVSLARQEWPDTSAYNDPEVVWRLHKKHHVGFVVASPNYERVQTLVGAYARRIAQDFSATAPPLERPPEE